MRIASRASSRWRRFLALTLGIASIAWGGMAFAREFRPADKAETTAAVAAGLNAAGLNAGEVMAADTLKVALSDTWNWLKDAVRTATTSRPDWGAARVEPADEAADADDDPQDDDPQDDDPQDDDPQDDDPEDDEADDNKTNERKARVGRATPSPRRSAKDSPVEAVRRTREQDREYPESRSPGPERAGREPQPERRPPALSRPDAVERREPPDSALRRDPSRPYDVGPPPPPPAPRAPGLERFDRPHPSGKREGFADHDAPRNDGPRHDGPRHDGPGHDGPGHDRPGHDGPGHDGPRHDGPRHEDDVRGPREGDRHHPPHRVHDGERHDRHAREPSPLDDFRPPFVSNRMAHFGSRPAGPGPAADSLDRRIEGLERRLDAILHELRWIHEQMERQVHPSRPEAGHGEHRRGAPDRGPDRRD